MKLRRNKCYVLRELSGVPYLLPYGQAQAEFKRTIRLNETGAFLWNLLEGEHSKEELLAACADYYGTPENDLPSLTADIDQFLDGLTARGCLIINSPINHPENTAEKYVHAGSLTLKLVGAPEAFSHNFDSFLCEASENLDQTLVIHPFSPFQNFNGELLLRRDILKIIDAEDRYVLLFSSNEYIKEVHLSKDGSLADFYCRLPYTDAFREELFHAARFTFLYLAQKRSMVVLHSASFLYQGRAWLFSGPSGTGKSTHTNLWREHLQVPLLNGDLNLLALEDGRPVIHGQPWCGTSQICDPNTYPLGGIILLKQAKEDRVEELSPDAQRLLVLQRLISPTWTSEMVDCNLKLVDKLASQIYITRLYCTKEFSAMTAIKAGIDSYLAACDINDQSLEKA